MPEPALRYNPVRWVMEQPDNPFTLDAKIVVWRAMHPRSDVRGCPNVAAKLACVTQHILPDGSSESKYGGGVGSVLWTAEAVRWLWLAEGNDSSLLGPSMAWLQARQHHDGSWTENERVPWGRDWYRSGVAHLWVTGAVLQALGAGPPGIRDMVAKGIAYLTSCLDVFTRLRESTAPPKVYTAFGFDPFSLVVSLETFIQHELPFRAASHLRSYLKELQEEDGCWGGSVDITQCATYGLLLLGESPRSPHLRRALDYLAGLQNEDGGWSHHQGEPGDWTLTAYTTRLFLAAGATWDSASPSASEGHSYREATT
jgi:hypothetical protein